MPTGQHAASLCLPACSADANALLQIWARVMGHMTTLFMSFLILPVARNSVWEYVYGIPFERAIKVRGRGDWA